MRIFFIENEALSEASKWSEEFQRAKYAVRPSRREIYVARPTSFPQALFRSL